MPTIQLVPFAAEQFKVLASWFATERDLVQWGGPGLRFPLDHDQLAAMLAETTGARPGRWAWSAMLQGNCAGHAQIALDWPNGVGRLARIAVAPDLRRQGIGREMLEQVVARGFACADIERLELNVFTWNRPAIAVYRQLGFTYEGTRRSSVRVGTERWDTGIMGLLRDEWTLS